jgi:hypothetical protein
MGSGLSTWKSIFDLPVECESDHIKSIELTGESRANVNTGLTAFLLVRVVLYSS